VKRAVIGGVVGLIIGLAIWPLVGFIAVECGLIPVATSSSPMPFEKWIATTALNHKVEKEAAKNCPLAANETNLMAGAQVYVGSCSVCHGLENQPKPFIAVGEFPAPPQLLKGKGVTDDPVGYTEWKVENGIRLTGMPSFTKTLSSDQLWQVSLFLANSTNLPPQVREYLTNKAETRIPLINTNS
jgi:mono/diheme cytochrome c family protein